MSGWDSLVGILPYVVLLGKHLTFSVLLQVVFLIYHGCLFFPVAWLEDFMGMMHYAVPEVWNRQFIGENLCHTS